MSAVNNDGELAIDISEGDNMEDLLYNEMERLGMYAKIYTVEQKS